MWLVYGSLIFVVLVIVYFIYSAVHFLKGMKITLGHIAEVTEKAREQGESIKKEQDRLMKYVDAFGKEISEKNQVIKNVINEGKRFVVEINYLKKQCLHKITSLK